MKKIFLVFIFSIFTVKFVTSSEVLRDRELLNESWALAESSNVKNSFIAGVLSEAAIELLFYLQSRYPNFQIVYSRDRVCPLLINSAYQYYLVRNLIIQEFKRSIKINFVAQMKDQNLQFDSSFDFQESEVDFLRPFLISSIYFVAGAILVKLVTVGKGLLLDNESAYK
jgi:hypothetical protein